MRTVLVMGGGMAGISAAAALAPYADKVVIVEKDVYPDKGRRKGTPQDRQLHLLLGKGFEIFNNELFPGLEWDLIQEGGESFNLSRDMHIQLHGIWLQEGVVSEDTWSVFSQRSDLERVCRRRLLQDRPNVYLEVGKNAEEVLARGEWDVVVDATGVYPISKRKWEKVEDETCTINLYYLTCVLQANERVPTTRSVYLRPDRDCMGCFLYRSKGRVSITLMGYEQCHVEAKSKDEVVKWLIKIGQSKRFDVLEWIGKMGELEDGPSWYCVTTQIWRHWERENRLPSNWIVMGDAYCRLDPAFGQGMTMVAMQAMEIRQWAMAGGKACNAGECMKRFPALVQFPYWLNASESWRHRGGQSLWKQAVCAIFHVLVWIVSKFPAAHKWFIGMLSGGYYQKENDGMYRSFLLTWGIRRLLPKKIGSLM
jgi:2-polyprenyl-6-methoxyphenol hydroxylase-like FAD-dependent oxidoreductase